MADNPLPNDWQVMSLNDAAIIVIDCEHRTPPACSEGLPYISIPQMRDGHLNLSEARRITCEHFVEWTRKARPQPYDVVLSRRCNPGETAYVPHGAEFALGQNLVLLRSDGTSIFPPYLRWLVRSDQWWEQIRLFLNVGAVFDSLKCADIPKFRLPIPPLPEQRAIAHILGTLDDKIELNRRMNATLEAIARTMFQSWFVNFDPVRAKSEGREPEGMDSETAALFPDAFEDSELGPIPAGWQVRPLPEVIDINPYRPLRKDELAPYLDMGNMPTDSARALEVYERPYGSGARFMNGDTLVARITPCLENGKTAFVDFLADGQTGWGSTEYLVFRPLPPLPHFFAYMLARTERFRSFAIAQMTGSSGRQRVPATCFASFLSIVPPAEIADKFDKVARSLLEQMRTNDEEACTLKSIRDALLPKLVSGQVRVAEVGGRKVS